MIKWFVILVGFLVASTLIITNPFLLKKINLFKNSNNHEKNFVLDDDTGVYYLQKDVETNTIRLRYLPNYGTCLEERCATELVAIVDEKAATKSEEFLNTFVTVKGKVYRDTKDNKIHINLSSVSKDTRKWYEFTGKLDDIFKDKKIIQVEYTPECSTGCRTHNTYSWSEKEYVNFQRSGWGLDKSTRYACNISIEVLDGLRDKFRKTINTPKKYTPFNINNNYSPAHGLIKQSAYVSKTGFRITLNDGKRYVLLNPSFMDFMTIREDSNQSFIESTLLSEITYFEGAEIKEYLMDLVDESKISCKDQIYTNYYMGYVIGLTPEWVPFSSYPGHRYGDGVYEDISTTPSISFLNSNKDLYIEISEEAMLGGKRTFEDSANHWKEYYMGSSYQWGDFERAVIKEEDYVIENKNAKKITIKFTHPTNATEGIAIWIYVPISNKHLLSIKYASKDSNQMDLELMQGIVDSMKFFNTVQTVPKL